MSSASVGRPIRVVVADDDHSFAEALVANWSGDERIDVVGVVESAGEAVELADEHEPDVVLVDLDLTSTLRSNMAQQLRERAPATRVMMLTRGDVAVGGDDLGTLGGVVFLAKRGHVDDVAAAFYDAATLAVAIGPLQSLARG